MIHESPSEKRSPLLTEIDADLIVTGGGLAGTCAAIAAAREGLKVVLVQDRPMLGGNASSEVRLWILGATSHLGNNNRWSREGGIINEILEENLYRNRQGNPYILDTILLEKCYEEPGLTLLLDTAVHDLEKSDPDTISALHAFCSQNSTRYLLRAPLFCDASGDGIVAFMAGAAFRMGAESKEEFGEKFAPDTEFGELLGHSMYFYSKDAGVPIKYTPPSWALDDITKIPRYRQFHTNMQGCNFWWLEFGGRLDTIHQSQDIKQELWKVIYGVWNHIKNSGEFPEAENLTLEWVAQIPGKRESRRFEGDYIMRQQDVIERTVFPDTVAHGGWAVDLHPADGIYSELPGCTQWHSKGVYGIPYRSYYSRNIKNLFLAGRIISATHVAFGSTRVMATCAAGGQAVGTAAALCIEKKCLPSGLLGECEMAELQERLARGGQHLPEIRVEGENDLASNAEITASSELKLDELEPGAKTLRLESSWAMLLSLPAGDCPKFTVYPQTDQPTFLEAELWETSRPGEFTPETRLATTRCEITADTGEVTLDFKTTVPKDGYHFVRILENPALEVKLSDQRVSGVLSVSSDFNKAVATSALQAPPEDIGVDSFEFWLPKRRPAGENLALRIEPALECFAPETIASGASRPTALPNAWVADFKDPHPELSLKWDEPIDLKKVIISFDPDWDHPLESVLMTHPEEVAPFMVRDFDLIDWDGNVLSEIRGNRSAHFEWESPSPLKTRHLSIQIHATHGAPAAIFRVRCLA